MMHTDLAEVSPHKIRMIGTVFWAALVVIFVPQWFMHPVEFSPHQIKPVSVASMDTAGSLAAISSAQNASGVLATEVSEEKSTLFIDKPLTTTPPAADPEKALSLSQALSVKEAQVDAASGRLKAKTSALSKLANAPEVVVGGRFWVQVATYRVEDVALDSQQKLKRLGFPAKIIASKNKHGQAIYLLRAGPYRSLVDGQKAKALIDHHLKTKSVVMGK